MKILKELKTKNGNIEFIILDRSCTCSKCFKKIKAGSKFLRIKSRLLGTINYCSTDCMHHPLLTVFKNININEEPIIFTKDINAYTELYKAEMENLGSLEKR